MNSSPKPLLNAEQIDYLKWYVLPRQEKVQKHLPLTAEEYAKSVGLHPKTLWMWSKTPEFSLGIAVASLDWGYKQMPGVFKALFDNAQLPAGSKDRETIIKHLLPNLAKMREQGLMDLLQPATKSKNGRPTAKAWQEQFKDLSYEERERFMPILEAMGKLEAAAAVEDDDEDQEQSQENSLSNTPLYLDIEPYISGQAQERDANQLPQLSAPVIIDADLPGATGSSSRGNSNPGINNLATRKSQAQHSIQKRKKRPNSPK
jgi:hypothetical protein